MEQRKQRKEGLRGSWRQFWHFLTHARLSWWWILLALGVTVAYYAVVAKLPGSTVALYTGNFSTGAIMGVVVNYTSMLVLQVVISVTMLLAEARSVRSVRRAVWARMMGIESRYYDQNNPSELLSAVTSDAQSTLTSLISMIVLLPGLFTYLRTGTVPSRAWPTSARRVSAPFAPPSRSWKLPGTSPARGSGTRRAS